MLDTSEILSFFFLSALPETSFSDAGEIITMSYFV